MKVLIIDDDDGIGRTTMVALKSMGHDPRHVQDSEAAIEALDRTNFAVVFLDLRLGDHCDGLDLLPRILDKRPDSQVVIFTAHASVETAVQAIKQGAADYVEKPFSPDQIRLVLGRIQKSRELQNRIEDLESRISSSNAPVLRLQSDAPAMQEVFETAAKAASSDANILILGESGTGKTVLGEEIHRLSQRKDNRFVTVSCPSLTEELIGSELFGHIRGAFTGAVKDKWGKVSAADEGTLFLDEIGDLPFEIQPKLLRLLQERQYERIGETTTRDANVRVIAATNHDLSLRVAEGTFREDLFYRLNVITLTMPPLRDRREDIPGLAEGFLQYFASQSHKQIQGFSEGTKAWLKSYDWPGNLRELRNYVERAVILADGPILTDRTVQGSEDHSELSNAASRVEVGQPVTLQELEEEHLRRIVDSAETMEAAASVLGIDPTTLYRKRKRIEEANTSD